MLGIMKKLAFVVILVSIKSSAVITEYVSMIDPRTNHTIHLFSDCHLDTQERATTFKQIEELAMFAKKLEGSKEVIVEDMIGVISKQTGIVDEDRCAYPPFFDQNVKPKGTPDLGQYTVLYHSELGYSLMNIPVYNVEFRRYKESEHWSWKGAVEDILIYDDNEILNRYYRRTKDKILLSSLHDDETFKQRTQDNETQLLDMHIVHRIHHNAQTGINNSVVIAGGAHINNVMPVLKELGYVVTRQQRSPLLSQFTHANSSDKPVSFAAIVEHVYNQVMLGDKKIRFYVQDSDARLSGCLGIFYKDFISKLALDVSAIGSDQSENISNHSIS